MEEEIIFFSNNQILYIIKQLKGKLGFFKLEKNKTIDENLTFQEWDLINKVCQALEVNPKRSSYYGIETIEDRSYTIYYDKDTYNYFWTAEDGKTLKSDDIYLNFKYNDDPIFVYNDKINQDSFIKNMYKKIVNINQKIIVVAISSTIVLSNWFSNVKELVPSPSSFYDYSIVMEEVSPLKYKEDSYDFLEIKNIIENNPKLSKEEKNLILKTRFVFDEYHLFMNMELVKARLAKLSIKYHQQLKYGVGAQYDFVTGAISLKEDTLDEANLSMFFHEFFHAFQVHSLLFTLELSNEFFTRECLIKMYQEQMIERKRFISKKVLEEVSSLDNLSEEEYLALVIKSNGFGSGYNDFVGIYYVLAQIIPKETLLKYQFNPRRINLLVDALVEIDSDMTPESKTRASDVIKSINDLRVIRQHVYGQSEKILPQLDYYYQKVKGISLYDDLSLSMSLMEMETKNEKIQSSITPFLEEYNIYGVDATIIDFSHLFSKKEEQKEEVLKNYFLFNKTILSNANLENIIYYDMDGKYQKIVLDEFYQEKYQDYLLGENTTRKK